MQRRVRTHLLLVSCVVALAGARAADAQARLIVEPRQPAVGSLIRLTIDRLAGNADSTISLTGTMAGEPLHFREAANGRWEALAAIPIDASDSVAANVVITRASERVDTLHTALNYPHHPPPAPQSHGRSAGGSRLRVDPKFTRTNAANDARVEHENELAREVGRHAQDTPQLFTLPFLRPRQSRVTSQFGTGRVFNGKLSSSHLGVDYRGSVGDPIFAANRGVVALVAEFFLAGNVVYIDHGNGIVTGYFHMSEPQVAIGDTVERGQQIGLVGATGRVTGPHLHWSARFGALTIDPADLFSLTAPFITPAPPPEKRSGRPHP